MKRPAAAAPSRRPAISVIIPIYNVADHVGACIESLRAQTMGDFRALMIDDGSTDGSGDIALEAADGDPRFTLIRQENAGLSGARNTGLEAATGTYIAFVDSDDRVMPDYLMRLWQTLEETSGDWVACAIQSCHADGTGSQHSAIHGAADLAGHGAQKRYALDNWCDVIVHFPSAWNKLYRHTLIEGLRFDEGIWFEDHGFFHRAAARTDHIIHLPELLYLQTRDRPGQITTQDSDRVFEQFDVFETLKQIFESIPRPGAHTALERIASRLLFERSTALSDPDRRARFTAAARDFMARHTLSYVTDWDPDIALSWGMEMAGILPLSVVLSWDGSDMPALRHSLEALRTQSAPGLEVLIVCQTDAAQHALSALSAADLPMPPHWQTLTLPHTGPTHGTGAGFNHGLAQARGAYVVCIETGDALTPWTLLDRVEAMLRADADFGITQMRLIDTDTGGLTYHNGMHDMAAWPHGTPAAGPMSLTPAQALDLEALCSNKIFSRSFLQDTGARFTNGARPDWALCLTAALCGRTTYIPTAGVTVPLRAQGMVRWHASYDAHTLEHSHTALLETVNTCLSPSIKATLPDGWERKLFARALREQVYFGTSGGRLSRLSMLAGATVTARHHDYAAPRAAGLDPFIGPKLVSLLNPVDAALSRMRLNRFTKYPATHAPTSDPVLWVNPAQPPLVHAFDLSGHGVLAFRTRFHTSAYTNLNFRAEPQGPALFHLSLRHAEGIAVCNHQYPNGRWHREQTRAVTFAPNGTDIEIIFTPPEVSVLLDGHEIFRFGTPEQRKDAVFTDLETITGFSFQGDVRPSQIVPALPPAQLVLDSRLALRVADHTPRMTLRTVPQGTPLPLMQALNGTAMALLPARLWCDIAPDAALTLELAQGEQSQHLTLERADVAARIEALLVLPLCTGDSTLCLTLIEHVAYGGLRPLLSERAGAHLDTLAAFYNVQPFMDATQDASLEEPPVDLAPDDSLDHEIEAAVARVAQSQTAAPDQRPDPLAVVADLRVSARATPWLFLSLTEYFCTEGRDFEGLYQLAKQRGILPFDAPVTRWGMSATLPYLLADRQYTQVVEILHSLTVPQKEWLVLTGVAWTVREAIRRPDTPAPHRRAIFQAFMDLVFKRAYTYWERAHCRELTRTTASLIRNRHRLEPYQQDRAAELGIRVYGLSRQFWADLDGVEDLPQTLVYARQAFLKVMSPKTKPAQRHLALKVFEQANNADAPRLRREIFGPGGVPDQKRAMIDAPDLFAAHTLDTYKLGEAALRHMASPGALPVTPAVAMMAKAAVPAFYTNTSIAPYSDAQQAMTLLSDPAAQTDMTALTEGLAHIADASSCYLGLAMALALMEGLQHSDPARAQDLGDWMRRHCAALDPADYGTAPAVHQALRRLRATGDCTLATMALLADLALDAAPTSASPDLPPDNAGLPAGSPLFDTIVTVFSCVPYLDTRIPALRASWLGLLEDLGVPYVVVVGDGDGTRRGDVLHLDAPDDYEGLPQKTLATVEWVHNNTRFGHMLKIDDDCFLNAPLFFQSLNYRKFDYYGRRLYRAAGQMDREWHREKSRSARGRLELDKSPEPSEYADGGTGYALSRSAMAAALDAAASPEGQQLISVSFMEDKMLGDLLALRGIHLSDQDYRIYMRRRTYDAATPVAMWHNSFFPSTVVPVHLVHLDTHLDQPLALEKLASPEVWPRKIWPGYQPLKLGYESNALELISSEDSVAQLRAADVAVVACMRNEMFMLPHFLAHYRKLGVQAFAIADNCSDDGTLEYLAAQPDVALFSVDTDYKLSHYGVAWQQAMLSAFRVGKWSVVADADELLVWQQNQSQTLGELLQTPDFKTADAARIFMLDMYPQGPLEQADFATGTPFDQAGFADTVPFLSKTLSLGPYADQPSWTSALRHRLIPRSAARMFVAQKLALLRYRPTMRLSAGLHFVGDVAISPRELVFAHFKYNADFRRKAQEEVARGQHFNGAEEYRKYLALTSEARSVIHDPALSSPWHAVPFIKARLSP